MKTTTIYNGDKMIYEHNGRYDDFCCSCGLCHTILVKIKGKVAYLEVFRNDHLTAKQRAKKKRNRRKK